MHTTSTRSAVNTSQTMPTTAQAMPTTAQSMPTTAQSMPTTAQSIPATAQSATKAKADSGETATALNGATSGAAAAVAAAAAAKKENVPVGGIASLKVANVKQDMRHVMEQNTTLMAGAEKPAQSKGGAKVIEEAVSSDNGDQKSDTISTRPSSTEGGNNENVSPPNTRKKYASQLACAANKHIVTPLRESPRVGLIIERVVLPIFGRFKPALDNLVYRIDSTVDGVFDAGNEWLVSGQGCLMRNAANCGFSGTVPTTSTALAAAVANKWGATANWINDRFDVYIESWLPEEEGGSDGGPQDNSTPVAPKRLLSSVPRRVRVRLNRVVTRTAHTIQTRTFQLVEIVRESAVAIIVSPKTEGPTSMPALDNNYLRVAHVVIASKVGHITSHVAAHFQQLSSLKPALTNRAKEWALTTKSQLSDTCREYYNAWPLPYANEIAMKLRGFEGQIKEKFDGMPRSNQKWFSRQYITVLRICRSILGCHASEAVARFLAKSIIFQAIEDQVERSQEEEVGSENAARGSGVKEE